MLPLPKGAAPKFILLFLVSLLIKEISSEGRVVCYYTNWSVYRPGTAKFNPQNINPYLCTHLIYAFGGFTKDNTLKPFDKYQDIEQGGYSKFTGLKAYNKNLKTLLAIGGWNEGSSRFSPLVASPERRQQFIKNTLKFLRQNHFDGLDLDWEYPAFRDGGKSRDKDNYAQFVQELRSEFDRESSKTGRPRLLLTMAVPAGTEYIEKGYDIPKLNRYLDWFNLLSYDYHSAYEPSVNHHSPLYSLEEESEYNYDGDLNIDYSIKFYLQAGADRDKLVLGIPTYGRTYTLVSEDITDLGSPADGPGSQGDATREKGYLAYYEICQNLRDDPDWTVVQPNSKAMGPYAFRGDQWVGYDDEAIVKKKAEYVVENGLGGIMFWSIDNDDFRGSCGKKPYPLIEAAKEAMLDRLGVGDNEVARPSSPRKPSRSRSRQGSSNRNNIISEISTHKSIQSRKKSSSRRNSNKKRLNRVTSPTTTTTTTTPSSLYIGGRTTTPPPPTTPDPGSDFKCEEEGFFPHPRDCKKYFWCLDSGPSNLGIVAHQFTCPSGLYFNTAADSCDFSRNVLCKTKTTTEKPTTSAPITTSTTTTTTTTNSPRITAATSRQSFLRYSSTTEQSSEEEEYDDDEDDERAGPEEEEDPRVIKELIQLIKKVGGLEELEKQLLQQEDGSMVLTNSKSDVSSTTASTISKSLYHKVLSRPNNLSSFRRQFETNKLTRSTVSPASKEEDESVEVEESSKKVDSRYSSVVPNSRPSPQNEGIDKLPEFEGFLKEKPKYVTIQRTRPTIAVVNRFDEEEDEDVSTEFVEQSTRDSKNRRVDSSYSQTTTSTPSYVNIRRTRPSTAAPETSEVTEEEKVISSTRSSYQPLNRRRISTVTTATDESTILPSTGTPLISTTQRYKTIERTKSSTIQPEEIKTTTGFSSTNSNNVDENAAPITVQNLELNEYTTQAPIQKIATTHIYENIARRTTLSTTHPSTLVETTTAEPTTIRAFTTTNPTTTISSSTNSAPLLEQDPNPVDNFQNQNLILPITDPSPNKSTGLDTDGKYTTELTDKNTDSIHQIGEDEVTLTDSKVKVSSSSTLSSYNLTKFNELESSLKATNPSLSKIEKQVTVTSTDILTTPNTDATTTETTIQKDELTTKDILETVSSPRPFGFPRRRTRPTAARKPSSTTNHEIVTSTSTVTPPPTQKVSPLKQFKSNSRTTSRYQSRTYVEDVSSASNNARELNEVGKGNTNTSQTPPKRPLNTYSHSGENADDEFDNSISSRKRSYSWRSQVDRRFRPWQTTTTVKTTPLPLVGPDRSYRPQYGDERDNLETDDSYVSYRGESESDSSSSTNKARQFERNRGFVRTSSDDVASERRIGARLQNSGGAIEETQKSNRRHRVQAGSNSYRQKSHRTQSEFDSSLSQDDANFEKNRGNTQTSSENASSRKRLGVRLQNPRVALDESKETQKSNRTYGIRGETQSSDNNSDRNKSHRADSEASTLSSKDDASFGRSSGTFQTSSKDEASQRRIESQTDSSLSIKDGVETTSEDVTSKRKIGVQLRNGISTTSTSEGTRSSNRRYGVGTETQSADKNSYRQKSFRVQSESDSSLSSNGDTSFEGSRGNLQTSSQDEISQKQIETGSESSLSVKDNNQRNSQDVTSQRRIGVRLQSESSTASASEDIRSNHRTYGAESENKSADNNSNRHKSHRVEFESESTLSSKDDTNLHQSRDNLQTTTEDELSQKGIESETESSLSIKDDIQTSSQDVTSQRKIGVRFRDETGASEGIRSSNQRYGVETENQSTDDSYRRKSHRVISGSETSSGNTEDTTSKSKIGSRFRKPDTFINESEEVRQSNRRYGVHVDQNKFSDDSYRHKSNRVVSESSDSTLSTNEESDHSNQRITTGNISHKRIGIRLRNPTTINDSAEIRKSNRKYGAERGVETSFEGNNEDSSKAKTIETSKTTTVYELLNKNTLPSQVVTQNITRYYSSKTNLHGNDNVETISIDDSQVDNSNTNGISESTTNVQDHGNQLGLHANFQVGTSGVSAIKSKTDSKATHTFINASELTRENNTLTDSITHENTNEQSSQTKLVKGLNEAEAVSHAHSDQFTNTNIKQINEEGVDSSGKSDVRQYYTSAEDDSNTIAALHQGKIKLGNQEKTTFVRNKAAVNLYTQGTHSDGESTQFLSSKSNKEEHSINLEDIDGRKSSSTAEKISEELNARQPNGLVDASKQTWQTVEGQNGNNNSRRRVVVRKRIYRGRNNNTDESSTEGRRVTNFSSATSNSATGNRGYKQGTKATLNRNTAGVEDLSKVQVSNTLYGRKVTESSITTSGNDATENVSNEESEATGAKEDNNALSGLERFSQRRIQTSRNFGTANNIHRNSISSTRRRITNTEEKSTAQDAELNDNTDISGNEERNKVRLRQRIRPTRPVTARTNPPERRTRPYIESELSSLLAIDRKRWEFLDKTKMPGGGTMVRRRRPVVKASTEIPTDPETTKTINRRVRPLTSINQSTDTVRQRTQFLYRNKGSETASQIDENSSVNAQSERNSLRGTSRVSHENEKVQGRVVGNSFTKLNSTSTKTITSSLQNEGLGRSRTSEESLLVITSGKGSESAQNFIGNRKMDTFQDRKTTTHNELDEEVDSKGEILSFEESQNGSFRGRSQNALKSSTLHTLKTNKAEIVANSKSLASIARTSIKGTSGKSDESEISSTTISSEDSTTVFAEMDPDKDTMTTTEESSTLIPHTTFYSRLSDADFSTTINIPTTTDTQTTIEPPTTTDIPTTMDAQEIYTSTTVDTPTTEMEPSATTDTPTTMDTQTTMDTPTTINSHTTINTPTETTTLSDSSTEGDFENNLENLQLNIGETTRFADRTSEKAKTFRSFQSTRQQNTFQTEKDSKQRQSSNVNRKFGAQNDDEDVQQLRGKDGVEILYHRKKYWETFNKTRTDEADSPIIYVGTFGGGGYTPGRTGKFSPTEIQKIQEIFTTEQQTDGLTNINHDGAKFSRTGSQQNVATVIDENKEIRLTTTKDTSRIAGSLIKDSSGDLTRSQVLRTKLGRGKSLSSDDTKFSSTTDNPNLTTIGGNAEFTTIAYNSEDTTINADNLDVTMPQTTENINEESATITEDTLIQTTDFGMIDQKDTLTSTLSFGEEETTIFPPLPTATDKTTNALHKTSLSAFENNLSATTDGFVDTSTNSNLFFSEKSPNLAQSTGEISSKFNSAGFSKSRTRISTIQQGSSKGINEGQANEISDLDLNLKVNVSKDSTVSSNTLESKTYNSRTSALSKTNSLEVNKISEESTAEEGLQVSGGRYTSSAGRNLRVSNLKTNRRQFAPSSKRKQPNSSAESTEATVTETATESSSTPSETGGTTIRSTLIFLKGPRPDGRYAEEFGQDTISSFQRGSSFSTGASSSEENDEDHRKDLLYRSHEGGSYSRFHQGNSHSKSTSTSEDAVNWQEEDSLFTATENEGEEETKTNGKEGNENEEVSTIRSTLIFLKGPFQTSGDASTVSGIEDTTELNEPRITDSSQQTTPTRRTYVALNRSKTTHVTAEDSSLTHTAEQNEDRRSEVGYRGQQSYVEKSYSGDLQITPEHISSSVNTSDDEESINSGESDLSLNNRGTLNRKTYSTIDRERVKRPLQSSLETTSELNVEGESSTLSPSTISPSQGKPTRRRYSSSLRLRSTTTAPELATEVTEQKLETTTEKNESVRRYSSFRRKSSSKEGFTRKGRISSEEESEKKVEGDSIISNSNSEREVENEAETSQENDLENNDLKSRSTYSRRNFTSRLQSSSGRIGSQRTKSYGSVKLNDVTEIDDLAEKTYSSVNSGIGETKGFGGSKKSEQSSTEEESSILRTEGITEYTTILPEIRDVTPELSTEENVVTQATTTELEEGSAMTEQNSENLDDLEIKKTTVQNEEVESKTLTASEGKSKINEEQTTTAAAEDNNLKMSTEINKAKLNTREQTGLRFNRVRTSNTNKNSENIVNISSKIAEAAKTQTISSTRGSNESNRYRIGGARKIYETNSRRKVTTLKKGKLGEERTTTFSAEDGTSVPESVENDLFASSPSPDSLVTETIEFTANTNFNSDEDNQATTSDYFTTLSTFSIADQDKEEMDDPTTFDPNFSTTESNEMLDKIKEEENTSDVALTILEDDLAETTYPAISGDKEEVSTINETSTKQTEDTIVTVIPKKPSLEGGKFGIARTRLESVTKNEDKSSTNEESSEKLTTGARTYSSFNRNRLLLKTNQRINEESTGSGFSTSSNGGSSISEYRKRYGTNGNSRTKSIQTGSKNQAVDQKSAPAYSFSTRTRAKLPLRQNLEKSINANQNDLSSSEDRTSQSENEENSSLSEFTKVESEGNEKKLFTNSGIEFNLEEENSTISTGRIDEDQTEYRDEYQGNQNYSESSDNMKVEDYVGSKTTSLDNADNFEADIYLESNSSTSTEKSEDTKNRLVRPLPYLKSKNTFQNRQNTLKLGQNTVIEDEVRKKQSKEVLTYSERSTNISDETRTNVDESEETSVRQSGKTTSQLKFQRKPFPLSRNLPKTLREKSTNETESSIRESHKSINIESNQEESSVTNLSQEVTELHATLNEEHSPELLDSTNSTALNVNNSANNGLVREDSIDNNETSNPLKFNRRFQKISSGNRFQLNNNQNTESTVRTVNGRRVRVIKFRKPSINTVPDSEGKVNDITSQRPLVRKFFRKRPSAIATTLADTESSAEYRENLNEARDAPTKKFRKILVRKTPVYQEDTEEELQDLQVNSTKSTFIPIKSSEGKTRFLKVNSSEDSIDLDLQNEFSDTNTTSSHNISTTEEIAENSSYNITSTAEITQNAFADTEFNATSVESIEQTGGENITTTESEEQNMNTESVESTIQENGENITTTENEEQNINTESVESTVVTSTTKNKLFATRRPYKPTKPSISAITSTEAASATTKTYVRKYSSNFKIPKPPTEIHTNIGSNDENGEVFIRPLSSFIKNRPTYQNKVNTLNDGNEDDDDINVEDGEEQREDYFERNLQEQHDRDAYVADSVEDIQDEKEEIRDENEELKYEKEGIREDEEIIDEKEEPAAVPIFRPPVLQTVNRINTKSSGLPNLIIRLNNGFDSQSEKSELEVVPHSSEEQADSASASYEDEEEANIDQTAEDEFQSVEKVDLPIPSNTPQVQTTKATPLINHPGFVPKRPQNNKPRVINRPTFTTVHPASLKFRVTSVLASTPPSFKTNNTRSYERKYSPSSTEPTSQDNSLIEDLNIDALNARNKKIFETNSRKHTTVKPKPTGGKTDTSESETTSNISHNVDQINATTNEILNNFDHLQENVLENVIPPPTTTRRPPPSTTTTKMTTLYHIFALSAEDDATTENNSGDELITNERREKLVEINRVVEVYSKEDKLKKSKNNDGERIESSELKLEKNATLERLGEIGRVSFVKFVDSSGGKAKSLEDRGELIIEGRSTVADYTPTEPISAGSESGPVRNAIPSVDGTDQTEKKKEARKLQLPEVILGVETSTIPLEGLFEAPRKSKELPVSDEPVFASSLGEVYAMKTETSSVEPTIATTNIPTVPIQDTSIPLEMTTELPLTTVTEVKTEKPQNYIRPLVPLLRPESNESSPLVISIANLDKVILSKVPRSDSSVASSGRISTFIEPPKSINLLDDASLSTMKSASSSQGRNETVVQTQTSFSSEIQVVRKKVPRRSKSTRRRKPKRRQNTRRPVLSVRRRITTSSNSSEDSNLSVVDNPTSTPLLATGNAKYTRRTRPTYLTTTIASPTTVADAKSATNDIAKSTSKVVIRRKFGRPSGANRRTSTASTLADEPVSTEVPQFVTNPLFKRRFTTLTTVSPKTDVSSATSVGEVTTETGIDFTETVDDVDQEAKDSIKDNKFTNHRYNQIGETLADELVDAIKAISNAPIPSVSSTTARTASKTTVFKNIGEETKQPFVRRIGTASTTTRRPVAQRPQKTKTTVPPTLSTTRVSRRKPKKPEPFEKIVKDRQFAGRTYRPFTDYDYYDDDDVRIVGKTNSQVKVILHGPGIIECLDQGNFPHPLSCRKFISCAKMETGGVVGWEYTCPKGLSYDPVGGICNWAAGLGCKE